MRLNCFPLLYEASGQLDSGDQGGARAQRLCVCVYAVFYLYD